MQESRRRGGPVFQVVQNRQPPPGRRAFREACRWCQCRFEFDATRLDELRFDGPYCHGATRIGKCQFDRRRRCGSRPCGITLPDSETVSTGQVGDLRSEARVGRREHATSSRVSASVDPKLPTRYVPERDFAAFNSV